jgi:hypothetical protein
LFDHRHENKNGDELDETAEKFSVAAIALMTCGGRAGLVTAQQSPPFYHYGRRDRLLQPSIYNRGLLLGETPNIDHLGKEGGAIVISGMNRESTILEATGAERQRLAEGERDIPWWKWGPYLSERQWGTVRDDYSENGDAWNYSSHDQARSRAYHWGEDGLAGFSDEKQYLCFALALWNGRDPIFKERLFGLTNSEANHERASSNITFISTRHRRTAT